MEYLQYSQNYLSLKMKHKLKLEKEFPALGQKKSDTGFSHMVEEYEDNVEQSAENEDKDLLAVDLHENVLNVNPADFEYDEPTDTVKPKNVKSFDDLVELHPTIHKLKRGENHDKRIANLKTKVLQTLKVVERRKRDLSCESVKSSCSFWDMDERSRDRADSRGSIRNRSESEEDMPKAKKTQHQSRPRLKPPKIILTQQ